MRSEIHTNLHVQIVNSSSRGIAKVAHRALIAHRHPSEGSCAVCAFLNETWEKVLAELDQVSELGGDGGKAGGKE